MMARVAEVADLVFNTFLPQTPRRFTAAAVRILRSQRRADCAKARTELGYQPTSIHEAVREQYEFFCRQGWVKGSERAATTRNGSVSGVQKWL